MIYQDKDFKEIFYNMLISTAQFGFGLFFIVGKVNSSENKIYIFYVDGRLSMGFLKYQKTFYIFEVFYFINTVFNFKTIYLRIDSFDCVDLVSDTNYRKYKNGFSFYFDNYLYRNLFYCVINIFSSWKAGLYIENNYDGEVSSNETIISEEEYLGSTNSRRDLIAEASEDGHPYQIYR